VSNVGVGHKIKLRRKELGLRHADHNHEGLLVKLRIVLQLKREESRNHCNKACCLNIYFIEDESEDSNELFFLQKRVCSLFGRNDYAVRFFIL